MNGRRPQPFHPAPDSVASTRFFGNHPSLAAPGLPWRLFFFGARYLARPLPISRMTAGTPSCSSRCCYTGSDHGAPGTGRQYAQNRGNGIKRIIAAACLISIIGPARAADTQWYILWASTGRCEAALKSPAAAESSLRTLNEFKKTDVYRDEAGKIRGVSVVDKDGMALMYFPSEDLCQRTRTNSLKSGAVTDPEELK
jgi:hypothetical protein